MHNPDGSKETIRPFESEPGDTGLDRERDIQDILFEVSEVYAPFNVEVRRIYGLAIMRRARAIPRSSSAATRRTRPPSFPSSPSATPTPSIPTPTHRPPIRITLGLATRSTPTPTTLPSSTPWSDRPAFSVSPSNRRRRSEARIHSHVNIYDIKRSIVHEAGHTFGLSHVRSDGKADPSPLGTGKVNDVMAYDTGGRNDSLRPVPQHHRGQ